MERLDDDLAILVSPEDLRTSQNHMFRVSRFRSRFGTGLRFLWYRPLYWADRNLVAVQKATCPMHIPAYTRTGWTTMSSNVHRDRHPKWPRSAVIFKKIPRRPIEDLPRSVTT